jgi:hypothetical protein
MAASDPLESPGLSGDTLVESEPQLEEGDHERFAHYVKKDKILASAVMGEPVVALCGKVWVPNRDPSRFPRVSDVRGDLQGTGPRRRRSG